MLPSTNPFHAAAWHQSECLIPTWASALKVDDQCLAAHPGTFEARSDLAWASPRTNVPKRSGLHLSRSQLLIDHCPFQQLTDSPEAANLAVQDLGDGSQPRLQRLSVLCFERPS